MIKTGIIGASGYTGYELIKLLKNHPKTELKILNSKTYAGKKVKSLYPKFTGKEVFTDADFEKINQLDVVFLALPHCVSMNYTNKIKCKIIDLSADYRYKDIKKYEETYEVKHANPKKAVYGLSELNKEKIKQAKLIANPGCYPTCCLLATLPIKKKIKKVVFDCYSGWSGAGKDSVYAKNPELIKNNIVPYKLNSHRHKSEIEQFIENISFTPHVFDSFRGMLVTSHIFLTKAYSKEQIINIFKGYYNTEEFVKIKENKIPEVNDTKNTNYCHIGGFEINENQLTIISTIDNLLKGASGQAVQNMNIMFGIDEKTGLIK